MTNFFQRLQLFIGKPKVGAFYIVLFLTMRSFAVSVMIVCVVGMCAFTATSGNYIPDGWPRPVYDFKKHPLQENKILLGRKLFYETLLSRDNTISCNSCHTQYNAFTHADHSLSHGIGGQIGTRNSPALMNLAWSGSLMWDGAIQHIDKQAKTPINNPIEMDENMDTVVARLNSRVLYRSMFYKAYGDSLASESRVLEALSQFMLTMVSANAKYDRVIHGNDTFTQREANGYALFKQHCNSCHTEPLFTNGKFENNGLIPDAALNDCGRAKISGKVSDSFKFKVPTLRNVEVTYPYMHDGRFRNLQMVLFHYSEQVHNSNTLSSKLPGKLSLSESQKADVILFLKTLTDEQFLKDKRFTDN